MNTIFYLIGCVMYAYDTPVRTSPIYYSESHYHTEIVRPYAPPAPRQSVWVAGHYSTNGYWVNGHWSSLPYDRPRHPRHADCHRHADGRRHCGKH